MVIIVVIMKEMMT